MEKGRVSIGGLPDFALHDAVRHDNQVLSNEEYEMTSQTKEGGG